MNADAFLTAIGEHPEDDLHRLVFADWLEEHGQCNRAEFIRVQCRQAGMEEFAPERQDMDLREHELLARNYRTWVGELPAGVGWRFQRGFVDELTLPASLFTAEWERLLSLHPVTSVRMIPELSFTAAELAECPGLERLRGLDLSVCDLDELDVDTKHLLTSPRMRNLRLLNVAKPETSRNVPGSAGCRPWTWCRTTLGVAFTS